MGSLAVTRLSPEARSSSRTAGLANDPHFLEPADDLWCQLANISRPHGDDNASWTGGLNGKVNRVHSLGEELRPASRVLDPVAQLLNDGVSGSHFSSAIHVEKRHGISLGECPREVIQE